MAEMPKMPPAQGAPKMPEGGIVPRRDIKPLADEIDAILREAGLAEGGAGGPETGMSPASSKSPEGERNGTGTSAVSEGMGGAMQGVQAMADMLGLTVEKAQALYDAAQMMPKLAGKSPEELAMMIDKDMNLRMQLEKSMGAGEDQMARKAMAEEGMKAPPPPPTEPSMGKK